MKKDLLLRTVFLVFLLTGHANAQKHYNVEHYNGDNGLPQNSVKTIFSDSEGFIWLGTEDGLVRYDGQHFDVFNRFNLDLSNTRVIFTQPAVRKNAAQEKNGTYIKGRNAVSYVYFYGGEAVKVQNGSAVRDRAFYEADFNHLSSLRKNKEITFQSTGLPNFINGMLPLERYLIRAGNTDQDFFICENSHIAHYQNWKENYRINFKTANLWNYFTLDSNLYYYDTAHASVLSFSGKKPITHAFSGDLPKNPLFVSGDRSTTLYWNNVSDQAFVYIGKDLYTLIPQKDGSLTTKLLIEDFDLRSKGIEEIYYDERSGKIYMGSVTDGLFILSRHQFSTINIKGDFRDNVFYAQLPYNENSILTADGRIVGKSASDGKIIDAMLPILRKVNVDDKLSIIKDGDNHVWVKRGAYLFCIDTDHNKILGEWVFKYNIETLFYDRGRNRVWIGSTQEGLYKLDLNIPGSSPKIFLAKPFFNNTIIRSRDQDHLMVGTTTGLYTADTRLKKQKLVAGTEKLYIKSVYVDDQKNIWFTALEKGLMLLKPDGCLHSFPLDAEGYLASPHTIIYEANNFWIPTNKGLFEMSVKDLLSYADAREKIKHSPEEQNSAVPSELFYIYHTKEEGFNTNEFNGCDNCGVKLGNGNVSLPSLNGLVWFRPESITEAKAEGNIILDKAEADRKPIKPSNDSLYFPVDPSRIKLHFSTAYFGNSYNLKLSYALVKEKKVPLPSDWLPMDKDFDVEFSSLNSGNYTLIIRKLNGFGINNYTIKKIYFIIPPMWYQTIWANILFICIAVGLIYFYNQYNLRAVKRENAKLEELVTRRTSRLNKTLSDLEETKNEMTRQVRMLSRLLTSMTHDIQSPLNYIKLTSSHIPKLVKNGELEEVSQLGEIISDSSERMSNLLKGLLDYIKAHIYEKSLHYEPVELRKLVEKKYDIFKNMIIMNDAVFVNDIPEDVEVYCDYQMLGIMIHNLIDNAAKFTRKGEIRVYFMKNEEDEAELVISNTTVGVPRELQDMINAPENDDVQVPVLTGTSRTSLGLLIVKEIAALVGISLRVTQTDVTSFYMTFK